MCSPKFLKSDQEGIIHLIFHLISLNVTNDYVAKDTMHYEPAWIAIINHERYKSSQWFSCYDNFIVTFDRSWARVRELRWDHWDCLAISRCSFPILLKLWEQCTQVPVSSVRMTGPSWLWMLRAWNMHFRKYGFFSVLMHFVSIYLSCDSHCMPSVAPTCSLHPFPIAVKLLVQYCSSFWMHWSSFIRLR